MKSNEPWLVTDDNVMGGLSVGKSELLNNAVIFSGELSTENNGGFTSMFKKISPVQKGIKSLTIKVLGDGNPYQLRFRTQVLGYELAYQRVFTTKANGITNYTFNLSDFCAVFRGRTLDNAPRLEAQNISSIGFLTTAALVKTESKKFSLTIYDIALHD